MSLAKQRLLVAFLFGWCLGGAIGEPHHSAWAYVYAAGVIAALFVYGSLRERWGKGER